MEEICDLNDYSNKTESVWILINVTIFQRPYHTGSEDIFFPIPEFIVEYENMTLQREVVLWIFGWCLFVTIPLSHNIESQNLCM